MDIPSGRVALVSQRVLCRKCWREAGQAWVPCLSLHVGQALLSTSSMLRGTQCLQRSHVRTLLLPSVDGEGAIGVE